MSKADTFINVIQSEILYSARGIMQDLEEGRNFATSKQVGYMNGLLRKCMCPDTWRLWLVGHLIGRTLLESTKEVHYAEASAVISVVMSDKDFAKDAIGEILEGAMAHGVALAQKRQNGKGRVVIYEQSTLFS